MSGKLYIVPTPVGNLEDMSFRAIKTLNSVETILAEDTRTSGMLLKHFEITTKMQSHHKFNEHDMLPALVERLKSGEMIALISDAGTPAISDPGFLLVRECRKNNIVVECLPGCTAFVPALVNSGLPCDKFCFEGFLPQKKGRATRIAELAVEQRTLIIYESALRLVKTLSQLSEAFGGDREASVSREISKLYNTTHNGTLTQLVEYFKTTPPRGEIVVVIEGKKEEIQKKKDKYSEFKNRNVIVNN